MHHAYYIEGPQSLFGAYKESLKPLWAATFERFGIDEARELVALASLKNYSAATFLVGMVSVTSEAQQALLKLFEEPQAGTMFVVLLPHGVLMATLRSRMLPYPDVLGQGPTVPEVKKFLAASGKARSDIVAGLLKDDDGVKERVRDFVNALEAELYKKGGAQARQSLEDIAKVRDYLRDRSPSLKMLLEHLALSVPVV